MIKRREADTIKNIPSLPTITQLTNWFHGLIAAVLQASAFTDQAEIKWLMECKKKTYEELDDSKEDRFSSLSAKLAAALTKLIRDAGSKGQTLADTLFVNNENSMQNHGRLVSGRQIVWMIWDHNRTAREMDVVYDITHLTNLQWFGYRTSTSTAHNTIG